MILEWVLSYRVEVFIGFLVLVIGAVIGIRFVIITWD